MKSYHLTRREAAKLNRELKMAGYRSTARECYGYACNRACYFGGADLAGQAEVLALIAGVVGDEAQAEELSHIAGHLAPGDDS